MGTESSWYIMWKESTSATFDYARSVYEHPFTLEGLDENTTYILKIQAECGSPLGDSEFTTPIVFSTSEATGLFSIGTDKNVIKRIVNGQLIIEYNSKIYNAQGAELR